MVAYTATINDCEQSKDQWQPVLKLLAEMWAQGIQFKVTTYSATISTCEKSKDHWQATLKLLAEMRAQGIQPNVITYAAAIHACEQPMTAYRDEDAGHPAQCDHVHC